MTVAADLNALGWHVHDRPSLTKAVEDFQRGWALGLPLSIDGEPGTHTKDALARSIHALHAGTGTLSPHLSWSEFACKCGGRRAGCRSVRVHRALPVGLEDYRTLVGHPIIIVSGYRCPGQNAAVGGATSSQHLYGAACDVDYALLDTRVARLRRFSGIGRSHKDHRVRHVDVRHVSGNNPTGGTPDRPTIWDYAA